MTFLRLVLGSCSAKNIFVDLHKRGGGGISLFTGHLLELIKFRSHFLELLNSLRPNTLLGTLVRNIVPIKIIKGIVIAAGLCQGHAILLLLLFSTEFKQLIHNFTIEERRRCWIVGLIQRIVFLPLHGAYVTNLQVFAAIVLKLLPRCQLIWPLRLLGALQILCLAQGTHFTSISPITCRLHC